MHRAAAKLIALDRAETFLARGWPKGSQTAFAEQARELRQEIPPHIVAAYDQLKAEHKVGVFEGKRGGCHTALSQTALMRLSAETEVSRCEHCGRFICLAGGQLASHSRSHQCAGGHSGK